MGSGGQGLAGAVDAHVGSETELCRLLLRRLLTPLGSEVRGGSVAGAGANEVRAFFDGSMGGAHPLDAEILQARRTIDAQLRLEPALPVAGLLDRLGVDEVLLPLLLLLYVVEISPPLRRVLALSFDDLTDRTLPLSFYLRLLGPLAPAARALRAALRPDTRLRRLGVLLLGPGLAQRDAATELPLLGRSVRLASRVVDACLGEEHYLDEALAEVASLVLRPAPGLDVDSLGAELAAELGQLVETEPRLRLALVGEIAHGVRATVEGLAALAGRPLLSVDMVAMSDAGPLLRLALREAWLSGALVHLDFGDVPATPGRALTQATDLLRELPAPLVITSDGLLPWADELSIGLRECTLSLPDVTRREALWRKALAKQSGEAPGPLLEDVAGRYPLPAAAIPLAAARATAAAGRRGSPIQGTDLEDACQRLLGVRLSTLAQRIPPRYDADALVVTSETADRLDTFVTFARQRRKLFDEWGFGRLMPTGRGLSALFHGPPGTGKTMAASVMAAKLGLELYRIDLSQVVDKYIGETEKNLARVFDETQGAAAVLLFDEADSLFTRRTDVRSSVDRYANLEVNYLLQRMEDFQGVSILTTNFDDAIDPAFRRRIKFDVSFPFPDRELREDLWCSMVPDATPLQEPIRWEDLAEYELAGGHIRNAVLMAAVRAADEQRAVRQEDLEEAAEEQARSLGRLVMTAGG